MSIPLCLLGCLPNVMFETGRVCVEMIEQDFQAEIYSFWVTVPLTLVRGVST